MSSGYFPLDIERQGSGELIKKCADDISSLISKYYQYISEDCGNAEDACSDGSYIGYLAIARELLLRCINTKGASDGKDSD